MIIVKGEIKTPEIKKCEYNPVSKMMDVEYLKGGKYSYGYSNVEWIRDPEVLNPNMYRIGKAGIELFDIVGIYVFKGVRNSYWHICFGNGTERDYLESELDINVSCLSQKQAANVFEYIKQISVLNEIKNEETGERSLEKRLKKITHVGEKTALARYLNPEAEHANNIEGEYVPIFPFGCNNSQYKAVKDAMENQISVIQGPPGTGKTQTILNIIANILMQGKTVQIVSNNNSATKNVYEKLSSQKYGLGFIAAVLGRREKKEEFIKAQENTYPDFTGWKLEKEQSLLRKEISDKSKEFKAVFDKQEKLANLKQEQAQLATELEYFNQYVDESDVNVDALKYKKRVSSKRWMLLWQECQMISEGKQIIGFLFKFKNFFLYGISNQKFYKQDIAKIITTFQAMYYRAKDVELTKQIQEIESYLNNVKHGLVDEFSQESMAILKDELARKYAEKEKRVVFNEDDLWKKSNSVLEEYPVILSTTFSSRNSLNSNVVYDYLIMDEASQVDVATGALALSCATNVVIVGDTKQLPNVVTEDVKERAKAIFNSFGIHEGYQFTKSFLQSVLDVMPNVAQTLLREHYRCHPKIINFCRGELVVMTEDNGEADVLAAIKTAPGNHSRNHFSQRQIDVIKNEVLPKYSDGENEIGIIAPYKNQVAAMKKEFSGVEVDTVHKFQGKEKDNIIISTVDDEISEFADDPYLINVAVSRAKKRLALVVTSNKQSQESNINDLLAYIQYNNFEVTDSKTYSVFDYLYKQYTEERKEFLQTHKRISEYDSENLMHALIEDILSMEKYSSFDVVSHFPLNMLIKNPELLDERECKYAMNPATHVDFLLYNRISKIPVLAIEVDGYKYHKEDTEQSERDEMKNHIFELYEIPLLRFKTNGSGEKERIVEVLDEIV